MKMKQEHFEYLRERIAPLDTPSNRQAYREGRFSKADRTKDKDKRYRWDLLWATGQVGWMCGNLDYLNDDHIDTALRRIVPPLGERP